MIVGLLLVTAVTIAFIAGRGSHPGKTGKPSVASRSVAPAPFSSEDGAGKDDLTDSMENEATAAQTR